VPNFKVNFFFHDPNEGGWSETYYTVATDTNAVLIPRITALLTSRQQLLAGEVSLDEYRYHREDLKHSGAIFQAPNNPNGFATADSDYPFVAAECRIFSALDKWRHLYIRGVPDVLWASGPNDTDPVASAWKTALNGYLALLYSNANPWNLKTFDPSPPIDVITNLTVLPDDRVLINTTGTNPYVVGSFVRTTGIRTPSPRFGVKRVLKARPTDPVPANGDFIIDGVLPRGFTYTGGGQAQAWNPIYPPIISANFVRMRHRDVGRPFGEPRGRSSRAKT
jgi:hypothetical protein